MFKDIIETHAPQEVPRDAVDSFNPKIVRKRQRGLLRIELIILSRNLQKMGGATASGQMSSSRVPFRKLA